jgi:hypothetical protein
MTKVTKTNEDIASQIEAQEIELKELLSRVMKDPLQPLRDQVVQLEKRFQAVEDTCKATSEDSLSTMQKTIHDQDEKVRMNLKSLREGIVEELAELLTARLASMPQEMERLLEGQTTVKDLLGEVQQEQTKLGTTAAVATTTVMSNIDQSRGHLNTHLQDVMADARDGARQLDERVNALANELRSSIDTMHDINKRFLWLCVLCGLSFTATMALIASRFL